MMIVSCGDAQNPVTIEQMEQYVALVVAQHPTESAVLAVPYWLRYDATTHTFYYGQPGGMPTADAITFWTERVRSQTTAAVLPYFVKLSRYY